MKKFKIRSYSHDKTLITERRDHIISCSTKVFTKKGYDSTNIREIAQACNMSTGSLYHYFGSKEEILYSILSKATSTQAERIETAYNSLKHFSASRALVKLVKLFVEWHDENQDITIFTYQETKNLPRRAREDIFASENTIFSVFEKIITSGIEKGEFVDVDPKFIAHNIITIGHSWAYRRWLLRKYFSLETYISLQTGTLQKILTKTVGQHHRNVGNKVRKQRLLK